MWRSRRPPARKLDGNIRISSTLLESQGTARRNRRYPTGFDLERRPLRSRYLLRIWRRSKPRLYGFRRNCITLTAENNSGFRPQQLCCNRIHRSSHRTTAKLAKKPRRSVVMRPDKTILTMCSMMLLAGVLAAQNTTPPADQQTPNQQPNATQQPNGTQQPYGTQQPNATDQQNREQANNNAGEQGQTLIDPGVIYNARKPGEWIGKTVTLKNVMVQDTNDTGNFWVGSDRHHRLLIVKPTSNLELHALRVHKGDVVTV